MAWKVNRKAIAVAIVSAILIILGGTTKAEWVDLTDGGIITSQAMRCDEDRPMGCIIVEKDKKRYLVQIDAKGEYRIYEIDAEDEPKLIWTREAI